MEANSDGDDDNDEDVSVIRLTSRLVCKNSLDSNNCILEPFVNKPSFPVVNTVMYYSAITYLLGCGLEIKHKEQQANGGSRIDK